MRKSVNVSLLSTMVMSASGGRPDALIARAVAIDELKAHAVRKGWNPGAVLKVIAAVREAAVSEPDGSLEWQLQECQRRLGIRLPRRR